MATLSKIAIVVPCYNEGETLMHSIPKLLEVLDQLISDRLIDEKSSIVCVNDGSKDNTWSEIKRLHDINPDHLHGINLAANRGHQFALLAGLMTVRHDYDAAISIDADLQDDPQAMIEMVKAFNAGAEIVYGVRSSRATDTWFKRNSARAFYSLQRCMGLNVVYDHADYRLMSKRALDILSEYRESNLFIRGIVPMIGLTTEIVYYKRAERVAGESKYPLRKMLAFSIDGITSFSAKPMQMIFHVGLTIMLIDIAVFIYVMLAYLGGTVVSGWSSIMLSIWFLGSLILMAIGIVGEYVGKIFMEVKHRPRFNIKEKI